MEDLLDKYYRNECTPEEQQEVINYLQNPANELQLRGWMWQQWQTGPSLGNRVPDWQELWSTIEQQADTQAIAAPTRRQRIQVWLAKAVIWLGFILALGFSIRFIYQWQMPTELVYQTTNGQPLLVTLPNQSTIQLSKVASLRYSPGLLSQKGLSVWLEGDGLVQVGRQPAGKSLTIRTSDQVAIESTGGRFKVQQNGLQTEVILLEGTVTFQVNRQLFHKSLSFTLQPGDRIEYDESSNRLLRRRLSTPPLP